MNTLDSIKDILGTRFGVLAESDTYQLTVIARNADVAVGDLFLLPSERGSHRIYVFRTTQYANILNRTLEMSDIARNKLTMPDAYFSTDLIDEQLIELKGMVMGYAERSEQGWVFHKPRRLPEHLTDVYQVSSKNPHMHQVMQVLLSNQLGKEGIYIGDLLAGENALDGVPVRLPAFAFSHHIGVFGRTGTGKSNLMMVLLKGIMDYNQNPRSTPPVSIFAIDPHDEFRTWHAASGGADGIRGIVNGYTNKQCQQLVEPFYYLTARTTTEKFEQTLKISRADIIPDDISSIMEFSEQQSAFSNQQFALWGEEWIGRLLLGDTYTDAASKEAGTEYLPGTIAAVQRRLGFLRRGQTHMVSPFDPEMEEEYRSLLPDILCALERGRVLTVDTTLLNETEQFLLTTVVARTLFALRRALRSVQNAEDLPNAIRQTLGNDDAQGQIGQRTLAEILISKLETGQLPYIMNKMLVTTDQLPFVNVVIEEAPSVLNPQRLRFGSVFRDISRQGRKFGIGLTVVSQQVSEIDQGVLTQLNTEFIMALGNQTERSEAVKNASADMAGFERELQVMSKGQVIVSASYKDVPLPVQVPDFDQLLKER